MEEVHPPRVLPPAIFLAALLAMAGLHLAVPVATWLPKPLGYLGLLPVAVGIAIASMASRRFARHGTTVRPFQASRVLVTEGPFRMSRNPMYLGLVLVLVGIAALLGSVGPLPVVPAFVALIVRRFIVPEERHLASQFGQRYEDYRSRVRRWI